MADLTYWIIPIAGIAAIIYAIYLARDVLSRDKGTQAMQDVSSTIQEGASAFIRRQYSTIGLLAVVGTLVVAAVIAIVETPEVADTSVCGAGARHLHGRRIPRRRDLLDGVRRSSACG